MTSIFLVQDAWKYITYHKYNSLILLFALVLGFLFPLLAVNDINDVVRDGKVARFEDASHMAVIEYLMKYRDEAEMEVAVNSCQEEGMFETAGYALAQNEIVYAGEESYTCGICSISKDYLPLSGYEMVSGAFFSEKDYTADGERVCLLGTGGALVENGVGVGDMIEIAGEDYRVKGIVRAPRIYGGLLLPYARTFELFSSAGITFQYQVITHGEAVPRPESLARQLFSLDSMYEGMLTAQTGKELEEVYYGSIWKLNKYRILRAAIVIVFAGISLLLLFTGMILRERHDMAIRIALGGSRLLYRTVLQVGVCGALFVVLIGSIVLAIGFRKRNVVLLLKE